MWRTMCKLPPLSKANYRMRISSPSQPTNPPTISSSAPVTTSPISSAPTSQVSDKLTQHMRDNTLFFLLISSSKCIFLHSRRTLQLPNHHFVQPFVQQIRPRQAPLLVGMWQGTSVHLGHLPRHCTQVQLNAAISIWVGWASRCVCLDPQESTQTSSMPIRQQMCADKIAHLMMICRVVEAQLTSRLPSTVLLSRVVRPKYLGSLLVLTSRKGRSRKEQASITWIRPIANVH